MAKNPSLPFAVEQMRGAGHVTARAMFGEHAIYCDGKLVALFCDDQLFVKPTDAGRALLSEATEAAPYPGAKPHLRVDAGDWEDADSLATLIRVTADALPAPKPRKPKQT